MREVWALPSPVPVLILQGHEGRPCRGGVVIELDGLDLGVGEERHQALLLQALKLLEEGGLEDTVLGDRAQAGLAHGATVEPDEATSARLPYLPSMNRFLTTSLYQELGNQPGLFSPSFPPFLSTCI